MRPTYAATLALLLWPVAAIAAEPLSPECVARLGSTSFRFGREVRFLSFTPDSTGILAAHTDGGAMLWDVKTGERRFKLGTHSWEPLAALCWSPDGGSLLQLRGRYQRGRRPSTLEFIRINPFVATEQTRSSVGTVRTVGPGTAAFAPGGASFAVARSAGILSVRDLEFNELAQADIELQSPRALAISPDGKYAAMAPQMGRARLLDTATGETVAILPEGFRGDAMEFSPDSKFLALPASDRGMFICDATTGELQFHVTYGSLRKPTCSAFSVDSKRLVAGGLEEGAVIDIRSGKVSVRFQSGAPITRVAFSPDDTLVAAARDDGVILLYDAATGAPKFESAYPWGAVESLRFCADGRGVIVSALDHYRFELNDEKQRLQGPASQPVSASVSPDGKRAIISGWISDDRLFSLVETGSGRLLHDLALEDGDAAPDPRGRMCFSRDGRMLVARSRRGVAVFDSHTGVTLRHFAETSWPFVALDDIAISDNGRFLAISGSRSEAQPEVRVLIYNMATGALLRQLEYGKGAARKLSISSDGRLLAALIAESSTSPRTEGKPVVWNVTSGQVIDRFTHDAMVYSAALSPDGRMLALGDDSGGLALWEMASIQVRHQFYGHGQRIEALDFHADGHLLAAASADAPILVWSIAKPARKKLERIPIDEVQIDKLWENLAGDASTGFATVRRLVEDPERAIALIRERLRPVPVADASRLPQLLRELNSTRYAVRRRGLPELNLLADQCEYHVRAALKNAWSAELALVLEQALATAQAASGDWMRAVRCLEVLELIATPEARKLIAELSAGAPGARLTREAMAARDRLLRR